MSVVVEFRAIGQPQPQGSARAFVRGGRAHITTANPKLHNWRDVVGWSAREAMASRPLVDEGPIWVMATFILTRPKSAPKSRVCPTTKPDVDKLSRGLLDALTGVCWRDDSQVVGLMVAKRYCTNGEHPGVEVQVTQNAAPTSAARAAS